MKYINTIIGSMRQARKDSASLPQTLDMEFDSRSLVQDAGFRHKVWNQAQTRLEPDSNKTQTGLKLSNRLTLQISKFSSAL